MVDAGVVQTAAGGEAGLAGPDDEGVNVGHGALESGEGRGPTQVGRAAPRMVGQPASTEMATGTPLVSTSKTAERLRDCSTTLASFSGSSPRSLKLMRICS